MQNDADDLIGGVLPSLPERGERDGATVRVDVSRVAARGRPRKYPWADEMAHGEARWIEGETCSGATARTLRSRFNRPGSPRRFRFAGGEGGVWCICVDARADER